jgi:methyl acetate hydrolase
VTLDPARFEGLDALLANAVEGGRVPGAVGIVADADGTRHLGAHGTRGAGLPMAADTLFRIASLTKAVVAIAVLACVERGELDLDTPVRDIIAAFDNVMVLDGFDGDRPRLRPPRRQATVRHLLTHTSGLTYDAFSAELLRYGELSGVPMPSSGLRACFATPLLFDPGERFAYGMSTDWTGQVLEALTGVPLADHLRASVAEPLGLRDLAFTLNPDQRRRLAGVELREPDGSFETIEFEWPVDPQFDSAGHGLYSTAADYMKVQRLLLRGGELDGVRLLAPETVAMMTRDQLGGMRIERMPSTRPQFTHDLDVGPGVTWGLDIMVTAVAEPGRRAAGSAGWCGTFNNYFWVDFATGVAAALHMSYLPLFDPGAIELFREFERGVYAALEGGEDA